MILKREPFRADTEWLIEKVSLYVGSVEKAIADACEEDKARIKRMNINSADDFDSQREELHVHRLLFEEDFPSKLRYSFVLLCYMFFESRTKELAEELKGRKLSPDGMPKRKPGESFPDLVKRFLETRLNNGIFLDASFWDQLVDLNNVRNCIVHVNGDVNGDWDRSRILKTVERNKDRGLSLNEREFIKIEVDYCRHAVELVATFFETVFEKAGFGPAEQIVGLV